MNTERQEKGSSILRALAVLETVAGSDRPLTATELNQTLGLPKATCHRLCQALERAGFLQRRLNGRQLMPGRRLHKLALGVLASGHYRARQHAILLALSEEIGETCNIAVPDGSEMIYFDRVETHWPLRMQLPIATRVPLYCTASGKLFLSTLREDSRKGLLATLNLQQRTRNTITDIQALEDEIRRIQLKQVGTDNEEFLEGMVAASVPIKDRQGRLYATVAFHAPVVRMSLATAQGHVPRLRRAAEALSALLDEEIAENGDDGH